jgi:ubiquinone/menaquinone biosynthesis C-methylase UbiE
MDDALEWESTAMSKRPSRVDFFEAIASAVSGVARVLELGSGPGFLAQHLLSALPNLQLVLLDFSPAMHKLAERRLGALVSRVEFVKRDFKSSSWSDGLGVFDAVVTNQAVHELRHKQHASVLHSQVRTLLRSGGAYLVCDHFAGIGGMSNTELYMTVEEQRSALVSAGFLSVTELLHREGMVLHHAT